MDVRIRILTIGGAFVILLMVIELVRRRKLKEEYSVLWVFTAVFILLVSIWFSLLSKVTNAIGAISPASTLFFFGLLFSLVLLLHFSVRISSLERRLTALVQEVGLMNVEEPEGVEPPDITGEDVAPEGDRVAGQRV
ncbi:MAG TPA: DUF2304 domain-containing protein [Baekduia sp.]|uniref:DUF2304 domain-containing protein n=1 Tax=Baekduia sp. TaxID=2600305 RepID=UPI002B785C98|nr:DUF2304 domain-containing protein [Baekduia sp.]HMJ36437.1 DUF2304 domain-containing protein [Baekduia sp.]